MDTVYIIDLIKLKNSENLNKTLTEVFSNQYSIIIGFDFEGDI